LKNVARTRRKKRSTALPSAERKWARLERKKKKGGAFFWQSHAGKKKRAPLFALEKKRPSSRHPKNGETSTEKKKEGKGGKSREVWNGEGLVFFYLFRRELGRKRGEGRKSSWPRRRRFWGKERKKISHPG